MAALAHRRPVHASKLPMPDSASDSGSMPEYIYDADMDELTILLYGRGRRSTHVDVSPTLATLVDPRNKELLGYVFSDFSGWLTRVPALAEFLPRSTKLIGERIIPAGHVEIASPSIVERAKASLAAFFPARTEREDLRRKLEKIEDACLV